MKLTYRPIGEWPGKLTASRTYSPFDASWEATLELLEREVGYLSKVNTRYHHAEAVVQIAVPEGSIRQDGQLRAGTKIAHPGVILNIDTPTGALRFSCDRFEPHNYKPLNGWQVNMRAIALGLEALRKVQRYGIGTGDEQYRGYSALPPGTPMPPAKMTAEQAAEWLVEQAHGNPDGALTQVVIADRDYATTLYRRLAKTMHPDNGGDPALFRKLTEAREVLDA